MYKLVDFNLIRSIIKILIHSVAAIAAGSAILLAIILWRLSTGPISLAFLAPYVEQALSSEDASYRVTFSDFRLTWAGWERTLNFRASDVQTYKTNGTLFAKAPEIAFKLSFSRILRGHFAPVYLELLKPEVHLTQDNQGRLRLYSETTPSEHSDFNLLQALEKTMRGKNFDHRINYLQSINVFDGKLSVHDLTSSVIWSSNKTNLGIELGNGDIVMALVLNLDLGDSNTDIDFVAKLDMDTNIIEAEFKFSDLDVGRLSQINSNLDFFGLAPRIVRGHSRIICTKDLNVHKAEFNLVGGPGEFPINEIFPDSSNIEYSAMSVEGLFEPLLHKFSFEQGSIDFNGASVDFNGSFQGNLSNPEIAANVLVENLPVSRIPEFWPEAIAHDARNWITNRILGGTVKKLNAHINFQAYDWGNPITDRETLYAEFEIDSSAVHYLSGLPMAENLNAHGWYDGIDLHLNITEGILSKQTLENVEVSLLNISEPNEQGTVSLTSLGPLNDILSVLESNIYTGDNKIPFDPKETQGTIGMVLDIQFPLIKDLQLNDLAISGSGDLRNANVPNFILSPQLPPIKIRELNGKATITDREFRLTGTTLANTIPIQYSWVENIEIETNEFLRRLEIKTKLGNTERNLLKVDDQRLKGLVDVQAILIERKDTTKEGRLLVDAKQATLSLPYLNWSKSHGEPAIAKFQFNTLGDEPVRSSNFEAKANGLKADGKIVFNDNGNLSGLILNQFEAGITRLSAKLDIIENEQYHINIHAEELDLTTLSYPNELNFDRPFRILGKAKYIILPNGISVTNAEGALTRETNETLKLKGTAQDLDLREYIAKNLTSDPNLIERDNKLPPLQIESELARILVDDQIEILNFKGTTNFDGELFGPTDAELYLKNSEKIEFQVRTEDKTRLLFINSEDAGAVLRAIDITDDLIGGTLELKGVFRDNEPSRPIVGHLTINDFHLVNAPILAKLLTIATLTGALELLGGQGLPFEHLQAPFTYRKNKIELIKARATGLSLGLTLNGEIDRLDSSADLRGTIIPAYVLNSFVGRVPLIGDILTGGEGQGVFAANYHAHGALDDMTISVNPLSALAPGILRDLFQIFEDTPKTADETPQVYD